MPSQILINPLKFILFFTALLFAGSALAKDFGTADFIVDNTGPAEEQVSDWDVTLGAGGIVQPEYEGGDEYEFRALPYFDVRYKDLVELNIRGLNVNVIRLENLKAGVGLGANFGRDEDDADRLRGLGDIDPSAEGLAFAEYAVGPTSGRLTFAHDLGDGHEGFTIDAEIGHAYFIPEYNLLIRPNISTTYASDDYMESFFGVNSAQSARSGLSQFDSEAGFKDAAVGVFARYSLTENWSLNGLFEYSRLLGDAEDSPVTEDENQLGGGLFVAYTF